MSAEPFNWSADDGTVIVEERQALALYLNTHGHLVIRERAPWDRDEDTWLVIHRDDVEKVARRMLALVDLAPEDLVAPKPGAIAFALRGAGETPTPSKSALRARAYRARKRDGGVTQRDAERDGDAERSANVTFNSAAE
jgi:hypothetical protein